MRSTQRRWGLAARVVMHGEGGNKTTIVVVYVFLLPRALGNSSGGVSVYNELLLAPEMAYINTSKKVTQLVFIRL